MKKILTQYTIRLVKEQAKEYELPSIKANSPKNVACIADSIYNFETLPQECLILITLDIKLNVIGIFEVARGDISQCITPIKSILQRALLTNATSIILIHNHPSGDTTPSSHDVHTTRKIDDACRLLDINLQDHLVIYNKNTYTSLKEKGYI